MSNIIPMNSDKIEKLAFLIHEVWKIGIQKDYVNEGLLPDTPRMRCSKMGDGEKININVSYNELNEMWKNEQKIAAELSLYAVETYLTSPLDALNFIHNEWLKRNSWAIGDTNYDKPFNKLSINEKEKDIVHYLLAKKIIEDTIIDTKEILIEAKNMVLLFL